MFIFQLTAVLFGAFMMYLVRIHHRKKIIDHFEYGLWIAVWGAFIFFALFPQTLQAAVQTINFTRVFDVLVVMAFAVLSVVTYLTRMNLKKLEKKLETSVREQAIAQTVSKTVQQKKNVKNS